MLAPPPPSAPLLFNATYLVPNDTSAEAGGADYSWDSNVGWGKGLNSANQSWMWKRHAGMDVVTFDGVSGGAWYQHGLNKVPEMIWIKDRSATEAWQVYHKGVNGGTNPENYEMVLNTNAAQSGGDNNLWGSGVPTATHFRTGAYDRGGANTSHSYIAMLFASVDGISKVGSYTAPDGAFSVNVGFQPRFLMIKRASGTGNWVVLDTTRGWGSGDDKYLRLNTTDAQADHGIGAPTSTGFNLDGYYADTGSENSKYIYYAHA